MRVCLFVLVLPGLLWGCTTTPSQDDGAVTFDPIPPRSVQTQSLRDVRFRRFAEGEAYVQSEWTREPSIWPIDQAVAVVISRFGPRGRAGRMHRGIDIKAPRGTDVVSTADGIVVFSGRRSGYGNYVEIDHGDGVVSAYGHFERIDVAVGDEVRQGMAIGTVGATGNASTPHVHYEVRIDGQHYDPWLFLPAVSN
jgi:murein DD-endopeptidase MepM/ murein hydrolase activator NlpD